MKRLVALVVAVVLVIAMVGVASAKGGSDRKSFKSLLDGYHEVPAISTSATGDLKLSINSTDTQITYTLTFSALQGGSALAAHIHFGQAGVSLPTDLYRGAERRRTVGPDERSLAIAPDYQ